MPKILLAIFLLTSACNATQVGNDGLRIGLKPYVQAHASALLEDGGTKSKATGADLLDALERGLDG